MSKIFDIVILVVVTCCLFVRKWLGFEEDYCDVDEFIGYGDLSEFEHDYTY